jgi:NADH-quinone oxidoreductase subunit N
MGFSLQQIAPAYPEIFLSLAAMALLLLGVFSSGNPSRLISWLSIAALVVALFMMGTQPSVSVTILSGMFVVDGFGVFMKALVLVGAAISLAMSHGYARREGLDRFEFPVLVLLATVGMMMMISASDLIALYLGLELQSLALYVLAAFKRDSERATEAGLKYFVLGALSSGMLLYGASLIYGFTGATGFAAIASHFGPGHEPASVGLVVGIVFLAAGLAFKVSAVPFHMWTPDVYEGAPTPVTAFFAAAPKVAAMALFVRAMIAPFGDILADWQQIIWFIAAASMLLGAFAAIAQTNIKRLMAYSSIGHVGYALLGLASGTHEGVSAVLIYMATYLAMTLGTFACILAMQRKGQMVEKIDDLAGLARSQPGMAAALAIMMFSLAGVPPMAGFFGKFYVFMAAMNAHLYTLAIVGVLSSVVGAYYYLRIVKIMYFDAPAEALDRSLRGELAWVAAGASLFTLFFAVQPLLLTGAASAAARSLFP